MPAKRTSGHIIRDEGTSLGQAAFLDFVGAGVSVATASGVTTATISGASGVPDLQYESRNSNTILGVADKGKTISYSAAVTQTLEADETLGDGWWIDLKNGASGVTTITVDPAGAETIDGLTTLVLFPGEVRRLFCNGAGGNFNSVCLDPGKGLYVEGTSDVTVASTTEGTPTTVLSLGAVTFDGAPIWIEYFSLGTFLADSGVLVANLWDDATDLGRLFRQETNGTLGASVFLQRTLTPSAASHTYMIRGWKASIAGAAQFLAGAGGAATQLPMYIRATKA